MKKVFSVILIGTLVSLSRFTFSFEKNIRTNSEIQSDDISLIRENNNINTNNALSIDDRNILSANMVNYNIVTNTISYETFNPSSYINRNNPPSRNELNIGKNEEANSQLLFNNSVFRVDEFCPNNFTKKPEIREYPNLDDRIQVSSPKTYPYLATALVVSYFRVQNQNTGSYEFRVRVGSGFLAGPNLLMTAGHCTFYDASSSFDLNNIEHNEYENGVFDPQFANQIKVFAGVDGAEEKNLDDLYEYYAEALVINIHTNYYNYSSSDFDWSAIQLDRNLGYSTGYYGAVCDWFEENGDVYSYGYPIEKSYEMWQSSGHLLYNETHRYRYSLYTTNGQSGSPVFKSTNDGHYYVCGIHTSAYPNYTCGIRIDSFIINYINSYQAYHNYEHVAASIVPTDYGYPDAYANSYGDSNYFTLHTLSSGFQFETKRFRTGYIHNEYIVMSPIRSGFYDAFLLYQFNQQVTKIEIQLTHWRELSHEWTYPTEVTCVFRVGTYVVADLLSETINLPTDRTHPTTYEFTFPNPTDTFQFQMISLVTHYNNDNRGRVCIGTMNVYASEGWY